MLAVGMNDAASPPVKHRAGPAAQAVHVIFLTGNLLLSEAATLRGAASRLFVG